MNIIQKLDFLSGRRHFNRNRAAFYEDLAEAMEESETINDFLNAQKDFLLKQGDKEQALIYERFAQRLGEEKGKLTHVFRGVVPDSDMLSLAAYDEIPKEAARIDVLKTLAENIRNLRQMKLTLFKAVLAPILIAPVIVAIAVLVSVFFIPEYEKVIAPSRWPLIGMVLYVISNLIVHHGIESLVILAALFGAFVWSLPNWRGSMRVRVDRYLPYRIYRDYNCAKTFVALASLVAAKKTIYESIRVLQADASPWLGWHLQHWLTNMPEFSADLARIFDTGLLSPDLHLRLSNYARRDDPERGLVRLGTDGMKFVIANVESNGTKLNIVSLVMVVIAIVLFYGGNTLMADWIQEQMKIEFEMKTDDS